MVKKQPVRRRKVAIECGFCKIPTDAPIGICYDCQRIWQQGKLYEQRTAQRDGDERVYYLTEDDMSLRTPMIFYTYESIHNRNDRASFGELLLRLLGEKVEKSSHFPSALKENPDLYLGLITYHDEEETQIKNFGGGGSGFHSRTWYYITLTEKQAEYVKLFLRLLNQKYAELVYDAYRNGSNLIVRMAEGSIEVDDLNRKLRLREIPDTKKRRY